jgi:hypothetical protein
MIALSEIYLQVFLCLKILCGYLKFEEKTGIGICRNAVYCMAGLIP